MIYKSVTLVVITEQLFRRRNILLHSELQEPDVVLLVPGTAAAAAATWSCRGWCSLVVVFRNDSAPL